MKLFHGSKSELPFTKVDSEHAKNAEKRVVFSPENVWDSHVMRIFSIKKGGQTYQHSHDWPHWVFTLAGEGKVVTEEEVYNLTYGDYIFIPEGLIHNLENTGDEDFEFICIVPKKGDSF